MALRSAVALAFSALAEGSVSNEPNLAASWSTSHCGVGHSGEAEDDATSM